MAMLKMVFCARKRAELSAEEFSDYWLNTHGPLVKSHAAPLKIRRYVQSHSVHKEFGQTVSSQRGMKVAGFDGVAELWWDSYEAFLGVLETDKGQVASAALAEDEARFIDMEASTIFFTEEHVVIEP